jgi:peptide deformylase
MSTFEILQLGHPHLRRKAEFVDEIMSAEKQSLFDQLLAFVVAKNGLGIAAVQVDINQRIFIMCSRANLRYPNAPEMSATIIINPEILWCSTEIEKDWEGCLSLPGIRGLVPRHHTIKVRYTSRYNETVEIKYSGFIARVFQHEFDHLEGIVFIDRVESSQDIMMDKEWLKQFAKT